MKIITIKNLKINGKILNFIILMGEDMNKTLNENYSSKKDGHSLKRWLVSVSFILFLFNIWKFLNTPGSEIPLLSLLFNMIIYLGIIIFIIHKKEMSFDYYKFLQS